MSQPTHHGEQLVDADVFCSLTRFQLRSARQMRTMRRRFEQVTQDAQTREVPGLLQSAFLVESPTACFSLSVWNGKPFFSAKVPSHISAANEAFAWLGVDEAGPQLWTTQWRLSAVTNNLNWPGLDLRGAIDLQTAGASR